MLKKLDRQCLQSGFSLVEVMVALVVLAVGLLGIAKLQGAAFSNTSTAARRSLAAIEADSMAAAMHANRGYWTSADAAGMTLTITGATAGSPSNGGALLTTALGGSPNCRSTTTPCSINNMAAYDLIKWAAALSSVLPNETATIACGTVTPYACTINVNWSENAVAVNSNEASAAASALAASTVGTFQNPSYTLYVQP
jgi:type IV pilus assembly protein PilV